MNTVYVIEAWEYYNSFEQACNSYGKSRIYKQCCDNPKSIEAWIKHIKEMGLPCFYIYKVVCLYNIPTGVIKKLIESNNDAIDCSLLFEIKPISYQTGINKVYYQ